MGSPRFPIWACPRNDRPLRSPDLRRGSRLDPAPITHRPCQQRRSGSLGGTAPGPERREGMLRLMTAGWFRRGRRHQSLPLLRAVTAVLLPRKRVVRLSGSAGRSVSTSVQRKRPESRDGSDEHNHGASQSTREGEQQQEPRQDAVVGVNTPVMPVRTVRIAVGSSSRKQWSGGSASLASKYSSAFSDHDTAHAPATAGRPQSAVSQGSVPRYTASRKEDGAPPSSQLRKRAAIKVQGTFLRGPARRARRQQSEEDTEEQGDGGSIGSSQKRESQRPPDSDQDQADHHLASSFAPRSRMSDCAESGSPVSAKHSARALILNRASTLDQPAAEHPLQSQAGPMYQAHVPTRTSGYDKENEIPALDVFTALSMTAGKDIIEQGRPFSVDPAPAVAQPSQISPERKALAPKNDNRPAPLPPPKMSMVETATAAGGASAAAQANKRKQIRFRVNGRLSTRIGSLGRGGSGEGTIELPLRAATCWP